jgi:chromosome segregation ATPase
MDRRRDGRAVLVSIDVARKKTWHQFWTTIGRVHKNAFVSVDEPNAQGSDGDARIVALSAEIAALRNDNTSLRDDLARTQGALANLRVRYHQLLEELHLLKRRLIVAKAERLDDVAEAQLAFDKLLAETQAIEKVLDAAGGAEDDNDEDDDAGDKPKNKRRSRTGPPPTGRRKLEGSGLPEVRVELADPGLEGEQRHVS